MFKLLVLALAAAANAANFDVQVGKGGLTFTPDSVTAAKGDTVTFHFVGGFHDAVVGDFDKPCTPNGNGFASKRYQGTDAGTQKFTVTLNSTDPLYYFCSVGQHCANGMVAAINPASGKTVADYRTASKGKAAKEPTSTYGGVASP
ncbi:Cupredoxin [Thozetella sp. PMI_491]|nr:Cupredoxin [Thozetella sp. PMI_491]